jgi:RimJ/RimL family protein N-acetyltransferase
MDLQPTLTGSLLELRPLRADDWPMLLHAASDQLIWEQHPERDRWKPDVFRRYFDGAMESGGAFAILDRVTGQIIGSSRYCDYRPDESQIEIGWTFLERKYWGGEYNGELKRLMIDHALRFVENVVFVVGEKTVRSQRALAKIGATFLKNDTATAPDGTLRRNVLFVIRRTSPVTSAS